MKERSFEKEILEVEILSWMPLRVSSNSCDLVMKCFDTVGATVCEWFDDRSSCVPSHCPYCHSHPVGLTVCE